jgi:hypothetical protein
MFVASACYSQIITVKTLFIEKEYLLSSKDQQALLNIISKPNTVAKIVVPFETRDIFRNGAVIYGNSLTDGTILIDGRPGVVILNSDNAFRTKSMGSKWTLTKIKSNFWLLDGDLYSIMLDAYVGDDIIIKAKVDPSASSPLTFTWYKNGEQLFGKTQASLKIENAQFSDSGNYKVDVSNISGYLSSEVTSLTIR